MENRIAIFRAGRHRAQNGKTYTFSEADVAAIAAGYDPALHQAPYVLGHPKTDAAPAWGWVTKLQVENGVLFAEHSDVPAAFAEAVTDGRYRFRSADLYDVNDPANPTPGKYHLRSVGWLGAEPPSIKGLGPAFGENDTAEPLSFAETDLSLAWLAGNVSDMARGLRDWMIGKFGKEEADKAIPAWNDQAAASIAADVRAEIRAENGEGISPAFAEPDPVAARIAELDAREAALADREAAATAITAAATRDQLAFAETARTAARTEDAAFVDGLVAAGKLAPGRADQVKTLLGVLDGDAKISFAEGEAAPRHQLRALLGDLGVSIHFAELAPAEGARFAEGRSTAEIATRTRELVDEANARGVSLSYADAAARARAS